MDFIPILAQADGNAMVRNLMHLLLYFGILVAIWCFVIYALSPQEPILKWLKIVFGFCGLILVVNFLLALGGNPLFRW